MQPISFFRIPLFVASFILFIGCKKDNMDNAMSDDSANYTVSTFAGKGTNGIDPATGSPAILSNPSGIAFDSQGNLYVVDSDNHKIRKITPAGAMTTFAGSIQGYADGPGSTAQFSFPLIITIDPKGNAYVSETLNPRIRKITPSGLVTTLAGNGIEGQTDGTATSAQVGVVLGMVADAADNIYFTQYYFYGIRKVSASGDMGTFAGGTTEGFADGTGIAARFSQPGGLSKDLQGNLYVVDGRNNRIRKITPGGVVSTKFQSENHLDFMSIDALGNLFIVEENLNKTAIIKVSPTGSITKICHTTFGSGPGVDGAGNTATFGTITGMAVSAGGDVYVSELSGMIRKIKQN